MNCSILVIQNELNTFSFIFEVGVVQSKMNNIPPNNLEFLFIYFIQKLTK